MLKPKPKLLTFWAFTYLSDIFGLDISVNTSKQVSEAYRKQLIRLGVKCGDTVKIQLPAAKGSKK